MATRPFLRSSARFVALYALAEVAAVVLLIWTVGLGWTLAVLAGTFAAGVVLAGSQLKRQLVAVRQPRARSNPQGAMADGALVGLGAFLVFIPGIVTTLAGALMLAPPTRSVMRPLAATMVTRGVHRRIGAMNISSFGGPGAGPGTGGGVGRGNYIDGEVIDDAVDQLPSRR